MSPSHQRIRLGRRGEELAAQELQRRGYEIVERNWRCEVGEADIIARRGSIWAFVEVRTRRGETFGTPEESITPKKRARMQAVAERYMTEHGLWEANGHLLVVAVEMDQVGRLQRVEILELE